MSFRKKFITDSRVLMFNNALVEMSSCIPNIICIAQITWEIVNNTLLIYFGGFISFGLWSCLFIIFSFYSYLTRMKIIVVVAKLIYLRHICKRDRPQHYLIRLWKKCWPFNIFQYCRVLKGIKGLLDHKVMLEGRYVWKGEFREIKLS